VASLVISSVVVTDDLSVTDSSDKAEEGAGHTDGGGGTVVQQEGEVRSAIRLTDNLPEAVNAGCIGGPGTWEIDRREGAAVEEKTMTRPATNA